VAIGVVSKAGAEGNASYFVLLSSIGVSVCLFFVFGRIVVGMVEVFV
jgi:hypothetical protein